MKKLLLLGLSTFAISAHAWEPSYYVGAGISPWKVQSHANSLDFSVQTLEGFGGIVLFPHISLEVRAGAGINEGRDTFYYVDIDPDTGDDALFAQPFGLEITYFASAYFRPFISNEKATLYGLLGVTTLEFDTNLGGLTEDDTDTAASFGVGVSFTLSPNIQLNAEWKKLINADEFDIRGGTVGFSYHF
ncbi:porin family protein [Saccharophagus sp. K07]|jgi:opacity protein-like surface antigen|uniref:porin family protein n=1 Tax=Saccharophagus sp. K07 TaxID=2283636 RepID=UPI001652162D|nr:porin family protein [Saccharophagus sp. K07]MBC6905867.1 porin family protein [Saccharophagus sp. K07]